MNHKDIDDITYNKNMEIRESGDEECYLALAQLIAPAMAIAIAIALA
jgi:hypothetical protein